MESVIAVLIVVSVMVLSVYFANWTKDTSETKSQKLNDVFCFCLPCIATLVIGIAVITDFLLLPIVITAALLAGTSGLLVSWTSDQKAQSAKKNREIKNYTVVILIPRHSPTFRSVAQIS